MPAVPCGLDRNAFGGGAGAFSVGVPEKFVGNYRAAQAFLDRLEDLCQNRSAVEALRASAAYAAFQERWKLSVYFGLRFQACCPSLPTTCRTTVRIIDLLALQGPLGCVLIADCAATPAWFGSNCRHPSVATFGADSLGHRTLGCRSCCFVPSGLPAWEASA